MLTSKQRAYLRKLASDIDATFQIGKGGINDNMLSQLKSALDKNELVKISLLDTMIDQTADSKSEIADDLAKKTLSNVVSVMGKKITLYKRSSKKVKILFPEELEKKEKEAKAKARKLRAKTSTIMKGRENKEKAFAKKDFKKDEKKPIRNIKKSTKRV